MNDNNYVSVLSILFVLSSFGSFFSVSGIPSKKKMEVLTELAKLFSALSKTNIWIGAPTFLVIVSKSKILVCKELFYIFPQNCRFDTLMGREIGDFLNILTYSSAVSPCILT